MHDTVKLSFFEHRQTARGRLSVELDGYDADLDVASQHALCHGVLQQPHNGAPQWPCTVGGVVALVHQAVLEALRDVDLDALLLGALEHLRSKIGSQPGGKGQEDGVKERIP